MRAWVLAMLLLGTSVTDAHAGKHKKRKAKAAETEEPMVRMDVEVVLPTEDGNVVFLTDVHGQQVVPIAVGDAEALTIAFRLARRRYERPLTHDLLDGILAEMGAELVAVRLDDMQHGTFLATLSFQDGKRTFAMDARASDSIALAVGHHVPIYMARHVLDETGVPLELLKELERTDKVPEMPDQEIW